MRLITMITAAIASCVALAAHADDFTCRGAGKCICTESINPASVLGYNATDDQQSVNVAIVCINQSTMDVSYYTRRKENGLGATYVGEATPHE